MPFDRVGCVSVAELSLYRCDISGFVNEVPTHGMAGVMGRVSLDAGQDAVDSPIPVPSPSLYLVLFFQNRDWVRQSFLNWPKSSVTTV